MQCRRLNDRYDPRKRGRLEAALLQKAEMRATLRLKESAASEGSQNSQSQPIDISQREDKDIDDGDDDLFSNVEEPRNVDDEAKKEHKPLSEDGNSQQ